MSIRRCVYHEITFDGGECPICGPTVYITEAAENLNITLPIGIKNDQEKASVSLIPSEFITGMANVFTFGATKYGKHNFRNGLLHSRSIDAALRHILAILNGENEDSESGLPHVYHAACSLAMYDYSRIHYPELNDLYKKEKK